MLGLYHRHACEGSFSTCLWFPAFPLFRFCTAFVLLQFAFCINPFSTCCVSIFLLFIFSLFIHPSHCSLIVFFFIAISLCFRQLWYAQVTIFPPSVWILQLHFLINHSCCHLSMYFTVRLSSRVCSVPSLLVLGFLIADFASWWMHICWR